MDRLPIQTPLGVPMAPPTKPPPRPRKGGTPAATDPFWSNVVLLLQGDTLADAKGRHVLTPAGGVVVPSPDGLIFDGADSLAVTDTLADFQFTGSFTVEGEFAAPAALGTGMLLSVNNNVTGDWCVWVRGNPTFSIGIYRSGGGVYLEPNGVWTPDTVHSWAWSYDAPANESSVYIDGARVAVGVVAYNASGVPALPLSIGRETPAINTQFFTGTLRTRLTKGVPRYAGTSYVPPTWPVPTA